MSTASPTPTHRLSRPALLIALLAALIALFALSLSIGSVSIPLGDVIRILAGGEAARAQWHTIIWAYRMPRALTATLAGAALGTAGLEMQTLFRNPLADPFVLGISSGASLGVALVVLGFSGVITGSTLLAGIGTPGALGVVIAATLGSGLAMLLILLIGRRVSTTTLLIIGLMFGYAVSAVVTILLHFSIAERVQVYVQWTFGSFSGTTWSDLRAFVPAVILGLLITGVLGKPLNALLLGEGYARSMGVDVGRSRAAIIASASLLAGAVTAFCGPIGFLGIAIPHLCRVLSGSADHRLLIPATMLMGGVVALAADLIAHVPGSDLILPLNAITALFGAPIVMWVLLRQPQEGLPR